MFQRFAAEITVYKFTDVGSWIERKKFANRDDVVGFKATELGSIKQGYRIDASCLADRRRDVDSISNGRRQDHFRLRRNRYVRCEFVQVGGNGSRYRGWLDEFVVVELVDGTDTVPIAGAWVL